MACPAFEKYGEIPPVVGGTLGEVCGEPRYHSPICRSVANIVAGNFDMISGFILP